MAPLLVIVVALAGGMWFSRRPTQPVPTAPVIVGTVADAAAITVHVAGAVADPGLVVLAVDARVADAVAAAGGAVPGARLSGLNLAASLRDGEQIVVPGVDGDGAPAPVLDGRVRINVAGVSDLEALPGVGPVLADRIAAFRDANGPFETVEDLLDVPGIGEGKLAALRDAVALD